MHYLIVNPAAGNGLAQSVGRQAAQLLESRGVSYRLLTTQHPGHATDLARQAVGEGAQAVLSVGGDGTALEVASGLVDSGVPLGIVPAGTGNDLIKTTGTPARPLEALEFILSHSPRPIDTGRLNDRLFLNVCGTGFDVMVLDFAATAKKYLHGLLPYLYGVICAIWRFKPVPIRLTLEDGTEINDDVLVCTVANGRVIGGGIPIAPCAEINDHLLDVLVLKKQPRWRLPLYLPGLLKGKILGFDIATHYRCRRCRLYSSGMRLNADGEIFPLDEADFESQQGRLLLFW